MYLNIVYYATTITTTTPIAVVGDISSVVEGAVGSLV